MTMAGHTTAGPKLQFRGSLLELQDIVLLTTIYGHWEEKPNGIWRYRSEDGAGLNWSSTRGTVWFDGKESAKAILQRQFRAVVTLRDKL
jgi:hypothetical protein